MVERRLSPGERQVWAAAFASAVGNGVPPATAAHVASDAVATMRRLSAGTSAWPEDKFWTPEARRMLAEMVEGGRED